MAFIPSFQTPNLASRDWHDFQAHLDQWYISSDLFHFSLPASGIRVIFLVVAIYRRPILYADQPRGTRFNYPFPIIANTKIAPIAHVSTGSGTGIS